MPRITSFRDLILWQRAMELAEAVYGATERFPPREQFGLAYQLRKSAVSIPSNVAEGTRHRTPRYRHLLEVALGSHAELDTQCELATRLGLINEQQGTRLANLLSEVGRLAHGLLKSLETMQHHGTAGPSRARGDTAGSHSFHRE
jgi:four helix bundle protein